MCDFGTILRNENNDLTLYSNNIILDGVNVGEVLSTINNNNSWGNGNSGSVPVSSGYFLRTNGELNEAVASNSILEDVSGITILDNLNTTLALNIQSNLSLPTTMTASSDSFTIQNQQGSRTVFAGSSSYDYDNDLKIGSAGSSLEIYLNGSPLGVGVSQGLLRAINCNLYQPTSTYNIVWSNLTPEEQLLWKGGDPSTIDPIQSLTGNYWNFTKSSVSTNKIGWYIPVDLSTLTFQDLESFWAVIRFNTTTNITTEGSIYFQITTSPATPPNTFRTRINYSNPATVMNQVGYFYKVYALDTITTTTTANFGKGQEINQEKFKLNPCNVEPHLWSIPFNKLVVSPTGDTSSGYTLAPIQSISLQTASNINTFNFDLVSFGYLDKAYNLSFV